ncbi:MAG TPA: homoserine kinase [Intrasporangium sp.]|uniref:homoserine kinase n=1 Tax=Intrasporangium sp. TaxID=1925024 RepID=UPI002D7770C2|nr:homoserine kinase [Intrasporangium sp.]HET7399544.1 homoserine kinase [Intrasporangium sp.]
MTSVPAGRSVAVRVPASSANLGPGFDSLGLALGLWDEYLFTTVAEPGLRVEVTGEDAADVPTDESHLVLATMWHTWDLLGAKPPAGLALEARNGIPHGRGLGSSAAAIVAGVVAAQALSARCLPGRGSEVAIDLELAGDVSSRLEGHPDNASASVHGGLTVSLIPDDSGRDAGDRTVTASPALHPDVDVVVFVPQEQLPTRTARAVLPESVPLAAAAANAGRAALLVHALTTEPRHLHPATRDWLHQDARRTAYPDSMGLVDALRADGHAAVISGAGPSVLVLTRRAVADAVQAGGPAGRWRRLMPGIPQRGVVVTVA